MALALSWVRAGSRPGIHWIQGAAWHGMWREKVSFILLSFFLAGLGLGGRGKGGHGRGKRSRGGIHMFGVFFARIICLCNVISFFCG